MSTKTKDEIIKDIISIFKKPMSDQFQWNISGWFDEHLVPYLDSIQDKKLLSDALIDMFLNYRNYDVNIGINFLSYYVDTYASREDLIKILQDKLKKLDSQMKPYGPSIVDGERQEISRYLEGYGVQTPFPTEIWKNRVEYYINHKRTGLAANYLCDLIQKEGISDNFIILKLRTFYKEYRETTNTEELKKDPIGVAGDILESLICKGKSETALDELKNLISKDKDIIPWAKKTLKHLLERTKLKGKDIVPLFSSEEQEKIKE